MARFPTKFLSRELEAWISLASRNHKYQIDYTYDPHVIKSKFNEILPEYTPQPE